MRLILILSLVLSFQFIGISQEKTDVQKGILATYAGDGKEFLIQEKKRIKVWVKGVEQPVKGKFVILSDSTIRINGVEIGIKSITKLRAPRTALKTVGGIFTFTGLAAMTLGLAVVVISIDSGGVGSILGVVAGLMLSSIGIIPTVVGIPLMLSGKRYYITEWKLSIQN